MTVRFVVRAVARIAEWHSSQIENSQKARHKENVEDLPLPLGLSSDHFFAVPSFNEG
jgi:hypothetical protein